MRALPKIIEPTVLPMKVILDTTTCISELPRNSKIPVSPCLSVIGEMVDGELISIEKPIVSNPSVDNDSHWSQASVEDTPLQLKLGHDFEPISVAIIVRINKSATQNPVGVGWV